MKYMLKHRAIGLTILTLVGYSVFINDSNNLNSKEIVLANNNSKAVSFNSLSCEEQLSEYHLMVERILYGAIEGSVNKVYGAGERTSWDYKIIDVGRGYYPDPFMYRVTVEFKTFTGAHNPPFDTNIAVYDIVDFNPFEVTEISYEHYLTEEWYNFNLD